jgi:hypothetical protein
MHLRVQDQIKKGFQAQPIDEKGRRHYSFNPTPIMNYRPGIKVNYQATTLQHFQSETAPKKLTFVPPQKRSNSGIHAVKYLKFSINP